MTVRRPACLLLIVALAGCAGASRLPEPPPPEDVPELEAAVAADTTDADLGLLLATAYRGAGQPHQAAELTARLRALYPDRMDLVLLDGILREEAGDLTTARTLFEGVLAQTADGDLRQEIGARLEAIRLWELRAEVRQALAVEAELDATPDPRAVGVFPFVYEGEDPTWQPLSLALAEFLMTDLAVTGRLRVVERVRVDELLRELALTEAGWVEESSAVRGGRILGSGHVVQGRIRIPEPERLVVDAAVVRVADARADAVLPITGEGALEQIFEVEKQMALDLHAELGIELTPAERAQVNKRQTESIQALLAFGRGLAASDAGDFQTAADHFAEASELDPGFALASQRRNIVRASSEAGARRLQGYAARMAVRRQAIQALRQAPAGTRSQILRHMTQRQRAVLAEVLGQDRLGTSILLELVFRRPGGTP